jgi:hypothetical protein
MARNRSGIHCVGRGALACGLRQLRRSRPTSQLPPFITIKPQHHPVVTSEVTVATMVWWDAFTAMSAYALSFAIPKSPDISACQCDTRLAMLSPLIQPCFVSLLCLAVPATAQALNCRNRSFEGVAYIACSFDPAKQDLRLFWRGADGKPYLTFAALARDLKSKGKSLRFAMNGGMYQDDFSPVGLYVENERELTRAKHCYAHWCSERNTELFQKAQQRFLHRQRRSWHPRDGTFSCRAAGGEFRHAVRPDAHH